MIGLDTNVLARYYVADKADAEAAEQHEAARSYRDCESVASFDDQKFARRVKRLGLLPRVVAPT